MTILWTLTTAALWAGVAACYNFSARRKLSMLPFVAVVASVGAGLSAVFVADWSVEFSLTRSMPLLLVMAASGIAGQLGMLCGGCAMRADPERSAVAWAILQMAMVLPFLSAVLLWHESASVTGLRWCALPCLVLAVALLAPTPTRGGTDAASRQRTWSHWVLAAFICAGIGQVLAQEPSLRGWLDCGQLRVPASLASASVFLWLMACGSRRLPGKNHFLFGGVTAVVVVTGNVTLFRALDSGALQGDTAIVFPLAVGGSVVLYALLQCATGQMHLSMRRAAGFLLGLGGVVLLGWRG